MLRTSPGFTLIEIALYVGLFALLLGGTIAASFDFVASNARNETEAMAEEEGNFLLDKFIWNMNQGLPYTDISLNAGHMIYTSGTTSPVTLNNTDTTITNLNFVHTLSTSDGLTPESVAIHFILSARTENGRVINQSFSHTYYEP